MSSNDQNTLFRATLANIAAMQTSTDLRGFAVHTDRGGYQTRPEDVYPFYNEIETQAGKLMYTARSPSSKQQTFMLERMVSNMRKNPTDAFIAVEVGNEVTTKFNKEKMLDGLPKDGFGLTEIAEAAYTIAEKQVKFAKEAPRVSTAANANVPA